MLRFLLPLCLLLALATIADGQYRWERDPAGQGERLFHGPHLQGAWLYGDQRYYPWTGQAWGPAAALPAEAPARNFGLMRNHFAGRERYSAQQHEITPEEARRLLGVPGQIPDDAGLPFAVVVGAEADQARARAVLDAAPFKGTLRVQCYAPEALMIRDRNGAVMYGPGITLVSAAGEVIGHTDKFDSAEDLAEGLRLLDPAYRVDRAPKLADRALAGAVGPIVPHLVLVAGGVLLLGGAGLVVLSRRKSS